MALHDMPGTRQQECHPKLSCRIRVVVHVVEQEVLVLRLPQECVQRWRHTWSTAVAAESQTGGHVDRFDLRAALRCT